MKTSKWLNWTICFIVLFTSLACKKNDGKKETELYLRIKNDVATSSTNNLLTGNISVVVASNESAVDFDGFKGTADFGTIGVGQTTEYKRVSNRFTVTTNGQPFAPNGGLGIGAQPTGKWTLTINGIYQVSGGSVTYAWDLSASN